MTRTPTPAPFALPSEPVDKHEVRWFAVWITADEVEMEAWSAVYHVNTPWAQVCPADANAGGANVVDTWLIFRGEERVTYREGSAKLSTDRNWDRKFATSEEARECAVQLLRSSAEFLRDRLKDVEKQLSRFERSDS